MKERNLFKSLDINDPRRPIKVLDTVDADVPEASKKFLDHKVDRVRFPNGNEGWHHRITVPEGVMLAHLDERDNVALVQNYRHALGRDSVELPSGGANEDEGARILEATPEEKEVILNGVARREFEEEVGRYLREDEVERLLPGPLQGSVGYAYQTYHTWVGRGGKQTQQNLDDGEAGLLRYNRYPLDDAAEMLGREIVDPVTTAAILGLCLVHGKRPPKHLRRKS